MIWSRGRQRVGLWRWPFLGLLLVASFLGHDLLMAMEAVAAPVPAGGRAHHGSEPHAADADSPAWQDHGSTPEHPENCRIGQSAVVRGADPFERADQDLGAPVGVVGAFASAHGSDGAFVSEEPCWPPGTLRALFQVYRI
jgi:hypothetical protein